MPQGSDGRRTEVQDPFKTNPAAPRQVQERNIPGVVTPRQPNLQGVGEQGRIIGQLLKEGSAMFQDWYLKKAERDNLEGQMAYAEGKTEEEISATGNRFTQAGYATMATRTAYNTWYTSALQEIDNADHKMDSPTYQKKLSDGWKELVDNTAKSDPYTRNMMAAMAEEAFPKLVSQQIKSNNAWRSNETSNGFVGMLASEARKQDPTETDPQAKIRNLRELATMNPGLPDDKHREAIVEAAKITMSEGNRSIWSALKLDDVTVTSLPATAEGAPKGLRALVQLNESANNPYAVSAKGAKGLMQVMDATNLKPGYGVTPAKDNSLEERVRVGNDYLDAMYKKYGSTELALMAYNSGPGTVDEQLAKLGDPRKEEISLGNFVASFPYKETRDYVSKIMKQYASPNRQQGAMESELAEDGAVLSSLYKQGFSSSQIKDLTSAYEKMQNKRSNEFDKDRILLERSIEESAYNTGNLEATLDTIETLKQERGYSDQWAESAASSAQAAIRAGEKERMKFAEIDTAIANNSLDSLSASDRAKGLDRVRNQFAGELQSRGVDLSTEEGRAKLKDRQREFLRQNGNIVDPQWKSDITSALTLPRLTKDGRVPPEVMEAYADYLAFAEDTSPAMAYRYLDKNGQDIVALATSYDAGMNSEQALLTAITQLENRSKDSYVTPRKVSVPEIAAEADMFVDSLDPGWFSLFSKQDAVNALQVSDDEIARAKANPALKAAFQAEINRQLATDTSGVLGVKGAASKARATLQSRVELLPGGNIAFSGRRSTIREDIGIPNEDANNFVYKAYDNYMARYAKEHFGSLYKGSTVNAEEQYKKYQQNNMQPIQGDPRSVVGAIGEAIGSGNEDVYTYYSPDYKAFVTDVYIEKEDPETGETYKVLSGNAMTVPAKELGRFIKEEQAAERLRKSKKASQAFRYAGPGGTY